MQVGKCWEDLCIICMTEPLEREAIYLASAYDFLTSLNIQANKCWYCLGHIRRCCYNLWYLKLYNAFCRLKYRGEDNDCDEHFQVPYRSQIATFTIAYIIYKLQAVTKLFSYQVEGSSPTHRVLDYVHTLQNLHLKYTPFRLDFRRGL